MYSCMEKMSTFPGLGAVKCVGNLLVLMAFYHVLYIINHSQLLLLNQLLN